MSYIQGRILLNLKVNMKIPVCNITSVSIIGWKIKGILGKNLQMCTIYISILYTNFLKLASLKKTLLGLTVYGYAVLNTRSIYRTKKIII